MLVCKLILIYPTEGPVYIGFMLRGAGLYGLSVGSIN